MWIMHRPWRIFIEKLIPLKQRLDGKGNFIDHEGFSYGMILGIQQVRISSKVQI